ncbi:filament-like plant protein 4 [Impatiens glandulifera]|uniref:filament-like plant protein 4 n=1 Tax=Impatiens glandulifera TaxID=253017 RepID=UPI001FB18FFB|nr:filament-like plant protein 4 [Impatiens glandulifera]
MDNRRSWPWKKKSGAEKAVTVADSAASLSSTGSRVEQDKKPKFVQISVESYSHLTGLEEQVKTYEDQVENLQDEISKLNEKLSTAQSEIISKEIIVKQHAKVAEEAVSGWEKAEAEALALKNHLESVTLLKLTAEDRSSHLDGALKECMRQIRNLKEEHEQELHDVVLAKTKQWDKIRLEFESKINNLNQELYKSEAQTNALSRSLQERSNMIIQINKEKSQAEAEIELLKSNIESCERQLGSLKYEVHVINKELEIRNEEKNMSVRAAEVANKQHLEGVKKIAKLEAESQRLRGLVRKKLPGPAALAQMKLEVENLGETRVRRPPSPYPSYLAETSFENYHKYQKENELLTERLFSMEEETKLLKGTLSKRNNELQASRNVSTKTISKLQALESQIHSHDHHRSLTSLSEDGNDDAVSSASSWSPFKKEMSVEKPKSENIKHLELMDDFLEMEKLAYSSNDQTVSDCSKNNDTELVRLQSRISMLLESTPKDTEIEKVLDSIKHVVEETKEHVITEEIAASISQIHEFVLILGKEAMAVLETSSPDNRDGWSKRIEEFSFAFNNVICSKSSLVDFILKLSHVLSKAGELHFNVLGYKNNVSDCIDKIALHPDSPTEKYPNEGSFGPISDSEPDVVPWKCSFEEFEQLKREKENLAEDMTRCSENLENTKKQLDEAELALVEVKSQLALAQKMNGLAETQLKCMAESYKALEIRAEELETQINLLQAKIENSDIELQEERRNHQDAMATCKELQEQLQRLESITDEHESKNNQEKELAAAEEKLAECQETIFLLGKQLKTMRPPPPRDYYIGSPFSERSHKHDSLSEEEPTISDTNLHDFDQTDIDTFNSPCSPSHATTEKIITPLRSPVKNLPITTTVKSGSSTPEKQSRGFSRFFSSKKR